MDFRRVKPSRNFIDATAPFWGDDAQFTTGEFMKLHGLTPEDLDQIKGTNYSIQDLAIIKDFQRRMQQNPSTFLNK